MSLWGPNALPSWMQWSTWSNAGDALSDPQGFAQEAAAAVFAQHRREQQESQREALLVLLGLGFSAWYVLGRRRR